jgi:hypothetical protein
VFRSFQTPLSRNSQWVDPHAATRTSGAQPREPDEDDGRGDPTHGTNQACGNEVNIEVHRRTRHAPVELSRGRQILSKVRILQMSDAGWLNAGANKRLVEPGGHFVAEVHADRGLDRIQDQHEHEDHTGQGKGSRNRLSLLDRADGGTDGYRKDRGHRTVQDQQRPPNRGQHRIGFGQCAKELPLLPRPEPVEHGYDSATRQ